MTRQPRKPDHGPAAHIPLLADIDDWLFVSSADYRHAMNDIHRHRTNHQLLVDKGPRWRDLEPLAHHASWELGRMQRPEPT